jgi:hypothetical protein
MRGPNGKPVGAPFENLLAPPVEWEATGDRITLKDVEPWGVRYVLV